VEGRLQIRAYDDSQGVRRKAAEVVADNVQFLDRPRDGAGRSEDADDMYPVDGPDDDVPF